MTEPEPRLDRTITGLPIWLLREYLEELGGCTQSDGAIEGDGWRATVEQVDDYRIGSLQVGRVRLQVSGDAAAAIEAGLAPRLLRGGG